MENKKKPDEINKSEETKSIVLFDDPIIRDLVSSCDEEFVLHVKLTSKEIKNLKKFATMMKLGDHNIVPMICVGERCICKARCPFVKMKKTPLGKECLTGDTTIMTKNCIKRLDKVCVGDYVLSLEYNKLVYKKVLKFVEHGLKNIYTIKTKSGHILKCTSDHKIFSISESLHRKFDGYSKDIDKLKHKWVSIDDGLTIGNKVAISKYFGVFGSASYTDDFYKFFGYYLSDGSSSSGQVVFSNTNKLFVDEFSDSCKKLGSNVGMSKRIRKNRKISWDVRPYSNVIKKLLVDEDLYMKKGPFKFIPDSIKNSKKHFLRLFINRLWSGDGWITIVKSKSIGRKDKVNIGLLCESYKLIKDLQECLLKFGIHSRIVDKDGCYQVLITSKNNVIKFIEEIGLIYGKESQSKKALVTANKLDDKYYAQEGDIYWDYVTEITRVDSDVVYDIEIENTHTFFANGVLVHNCPFERFSFNTWYKEYVDALEIDESNKVQRQQIMDLVETDIMNARANFVLGDEGFEMSNPVGFNEDTGEAIMRREEHIALKLKDRAQARKDKIWKSFVATRETQLKAVGGKKEDITEIMARLNQRGSQVSGRHVIDAEITNKKESKVEKNKEESSEDQF